MGDLKNYIDNGIPISYMIILKMGKLFEFFHGCLIKIGFFKCGSNFKVGIHSRVLQRKKISAGDNVSIGRFCRIDALSREGIVLEDNVSIGDYSILACTGSLRYLGKGIKIGNNSHFGEYCFIGAAGGVKVGSNVIGGQNIRFHAENHLYDNPDQPIYQQGVTHKGIEIGDNCWIGAGAVFLDGAKIGKGCVVAANAVVTKSFGDNLVIGGIPAKKLRDRVTDNVEG